MFNNEVLYTTKSCSDVTTSTTDSANVCNAISGCSWTDANSLSLTVRAAQCAADAEICTSCTTRPAAQHIIGIWDNGISTCCDADTTGMCAGNTIASENHVCPSGKKLKTNATALALIGIGENCCENVTGMCTGNADAAQNVTCSAGTYLIANANQIEKGNGDSASQQAQCCSSVELWCTGNVDSSRDHTCPAGMHLKELATITPLSRIPIPCCSQDVSGKCSGNTNTAFDHVCPSEQGKKLKAASATTNLLGNGSNCCDNISGRCAGNFNTDENVYCTAGTHLTRGANFLPRGKTAQVNGVTTNTQNVVVENNSGGNIAIGMAVFGTGVGAGVTVSAINSQSSLVLSHSLSLEDGVLLTFVGDAASQQSICCTTDRFCTENFAPRHDTVCADGTHLASGARDIEYNLQALCCEPEITGMCIHNSDRSADHICLSGTHMKASAQLIQKAGNAQSNCCERTTGMCSGNYEAREDHTCSEGYQLKKDAHEISCAPDTCSLSPGGGTTSCSDAVCCEEKIVIAGMCFGNTLSGSEVCKYTPESGSGTTKTAAKCEHADVSERQSESCVQKMMHCYHIDNPFLCSRAFGGNRCIWIGLSDGYCRSKDKFSCDLVSLDPHGDSSLSQATCESSGPCLYKNVSGEEKYTALKLQCWALACDDKTSSLGGSVGSLVQQSLGEVCTPQIKDLLNSYGSTEMMCEQRRMESMGRLNSNVFLERHDPTQGDGTIGVCEALG
jgi:hypothetical protein